MKGGTAVKKLLCMLLLCLFLSGCAIFETDTYVSVTPHDEGYDVAIDSNAVTVSNYLGLKNAITDMVEECVTDGVIHAINYGGDVTEDVADAVYEVWRRDPLGAFAVDYMTYDCSKIVNYYEIHIHSTFRRTAEEIQSVAFVSDEAALEQSIVEAMQSYDDVLRVRMNSELIPDFEALTANAFQSNPEFALEFPKVSVTSYPESGSQRIYEVMFTYETDKDTLQEMHQKSSDVLDGIISLYGSSSDKFVCVRRFYNRIIRDGMLADPQNDSIITPDGVYSVLVDNCASSLGFAQTYAIMLQSKDIPCILLPALRDGQSIYLCLVTLEQDDFYVDMTRGLSGEDSELFLMSEDDVINTGYELLN